jgi:hypothetical protein
MAQDDYKTTWKIDKTDNHGSFPMGEIQKLKQIGKSDSYELKWKAGAVDCSIAPLMPDPNDPNVLSNPKAKGVKGGSEGFYNVTVVISLAAEGLDKLSGTSQDVLRSGASPGPLVGQWGAETPPPPDLVSPRRSIAIESDR